MKFKEEKKEVYTLAYADDIVLLAEEEDESDDSNPSLRAPNSFTTKCLPTKKPGRSTNIDTYMIVVLEKTAVDFDAS